MQASSQKYIRTGDTVETINNTKGIVHYVVNKENQMSFDEPICKIKKLIVDCGDKIEHLLLNEIKL